MMFGDVLSEFTSAVTAAMTPYTDVAYITAAPGDGFSSLHAIQITPSSISPMGEVSSLRAYRATIDLTIWWNELGDIEQRSTEVMSGTDNIYEVAAAIRGALSNNFLAGTVIVSPMIVSEGQPTKIKSPWVTIKQSYVCLYSEE